MGNRFSSAKHSIAECDRCGFRFKLKILKRLVIKTKQIDMLVCPTCWEPDQPQLQLGMYPVDDPQGVRNPRPDRSYVASGPLADGFLGEGSRIFQWGWNPVGGGYAPIDGGTPNYLVSQTAVGTVTVDLSQVGPIPVVYTGAASETASAVDSVSATQTRLVTLDPSYYNILGVLSNGDLTYTWNTIGSFGCAYATFPRSTGKYYFEIVNTQPGGYGGAIYDNWSLSGGIAVTRNVSNDVLVGTDSDAWGFSNANGSGLTTEITTFNSGVGTTYSISQIPQDGYLGVAVDLDAGKVWFNANGTWVNSGNPAAGTGEAYSFSANPTVYPAMGQASRTPFGGSTINFGATAFLGTVPSGFTAWNIIS